MIISAIMQVAEKYISPINFEQRKNLDLKAGDTVRVHQKIEEKGKSRIQIFEGLVLARKHGTEAGATFTVRRVASGVGVEKIFPFYSPLIEKIEVIKRSKVRRSKLYHIRDKAAKEIRRQMRNIMAVPEQPKDSDIQEPVKSPEAISEKLEIEEKQQPLEAE